jgi:hypothetical protein
MTTIECVQVDPICAKGVDDHKRRYCRDISACSKPDGVFASVPRCLSSFPLSPSRSVRHYSRGSSSSDPATGRLVNIRGGLYHGVLTACPSYTNDQLPFSGATSILKV